MSPTHIYTRTCAGILRPGGCSQSRREGERERERERERETEGQIGTAGLRWAAILKYSQIPNAPILKYSQISNTAILKNSQIPNAAILKSQILPCMRAAWRQRTRCVRGTHASTRRRESVDEWHRFKGLVGSWRMQSNM